MSNKIINSETKKKIQIKKFRLGVAPNFFFTKKSHYYRPILIKSRAISQNINKNELNIDDISSFRTDNVIRSYKKINEDNKDEYNGTKNNNSNKKPFDSNTNNLTRNINGNFRNSFFRNKQSKSISYITDKRNSNNFNNIIQKSKFNNKIFYRNKFFDPIKQILEDFDLNVDSKKFFNIFNMFNANYMNKKKEHRKYFRNESISYKKKNNFPKIISHEHFFKSELCL